MPHSHPAVRPGAQTFEFSTTQTIAAMRKRLRKWPRCVLEAAAIHFLAARLAPTWVTRQGTRISLLSGDDSSWFSVVEDLCLDVYGFGEPGLTPQVRTFLDIGAHIGTTSLSIQERFPGARCIAYEPGPRAFGKLVENVSRNGVTDAVECIHAAVVGSNEPDQALFLEGGGGTATSTTRSVAGSNSGFGLRVPAVSLENAIAGALGPVDLLKIDVEGAEYGIIGNTPPRSLRCVTAAVIEYHEVAGHGPADLKRWFSEAGFSVRAELNANGGPSGFLWFRNAVRRQPV